MKRAILFALVGLAISSSGLAGQSLFGTQGLGLPAEPLDGRARALGSMGVGLLGPSLSPLDIAAAARIYLPTAQLTLQPQWIDGELNGQSLTTKGTRFPQMSLAYPLLGVGGTAVLHIGTNFDQRWEVETSSDEEVLGSVVPVTDRLASDGGISTFQLGWAQRLGDRLSLGVGVGSRIGSVTRTFTRIVDAGDLATIIPYVTSGEWRYSGLTASLGFQWDPLPQLRLGGSAAWSGTLEAEPRGETEGSSTDFDVPTEFRLGASGILTPRLALHVGFSFADWQDPEGSLDPGTLVGSVKSFGIGMEWACPTVGPRNFPIRLGMKRSDLPFTFEGETPSENVFTGGIGLNLMPPQSGLIGAIDLAFERGTREAASLSESFWRASVTFRVGSF